MLGTTSYISLLIACFLAFYVAARHFSHKNFKLKWFWTIVGLGLTWGSIQLGLAKYGYIFFIGESIYIFQDNEIVRFAALASALMQTACIPSKEPFRAWF